MVYTEDMSMVKLNTPTLIIDILSYFSLGTFVLGSISYKLVGVETLYTIQIARLLQVTSKYHNSFFAQFKGLNLCYGQIPSFFSSSSLSKTIFGRLGFKLNFNDNFMILSVINVLAIVSYVVALIYRFKLKSEIKNK
jgi:hypothetical protein